MPETSTGVWAQPPHSQKSHFFPSKGASACGKWVSDAPVEGERGRAKCLECKAGWWAQPPRSRVLHFFPRKGASLCGMWNAEEPTMDQGQAKCTTCFSKAPQ